MAFRPSRYQLFLSTIAVVLIGFLVFQSITVPPSEPDAVKIAIIDSGCAISQSSDVVEFTTFTLEEYGYNYDDTSIYDPVGHGRYVCDIIIENTENVEIYSAKIANGNGQVTYEGLFAAVEYVIEEHDVDIINLSLGGEPYIDEKLFSAFEEYANSKVFVAAIGNKGGTATFAEGIIDWPATLPWVIGVGAIENSELTTYSSYGRDKDGLYGTEFVAEGKIGNVFGTSFATPRITAKYANLWVQLLETDQEVTPEKLHYLMAKSTGTQFSELTGFGTPTQVNDTEKLGTLILGTEENDLFLRFQGETWTKSWKFYSTEENAGIEIDLNLPNIASYNVAEFDWGGILSVEFVGTSQGDFVFDLTGLSESSVTYNYSVSASEAEYTLLLDHRNTVYGYAHSYGQYSRFEEYFRNEGIEVHQIQSGDAVLDEYDTIIVTELGKSIELDRDFARPFNQTLIDQYMEYTNQGGKLQITLTYPDQYRQEDFSQALQKFGALVSSDPIPNGGEGVAYTTNLTESALFDGVISIGASGSAVSAVNSSQSVLGYYKSVGNSFTPSKYLGIGIYSEIGDGSVLVWSGNGMMLNEYFLELKDNYDQLLINYLQF